MFNGLTPDGKGQHKASSEYRSLTTSMRTSLGLNPKVIKGLHWALVLRLTQWASLGLTYRQAVELSVRPAGIEAIT